MDTMRRRLLTLLATAVVSSLAAPGMSVPDGVLDGVLDGALDRAASTSVGEPASEGSSRVGGVEGSGSLTAAATAVSTFQNSNPKGSTLRASSGRDAGGGTGAERARGRSGTKARERNADGSYTPRTRYGRERAQRREDLRNPLARTREGQARRPSHVFRKRASACEHKHGSGICPVCGKCVAHSEWKPYDMPGLGKRLHARCPHCGVMERHRAAALVQRQVPHLFPRWQTIEYFNLVARSTKLYDNGRHVRGVGGEKQVAYFGPEKVHERMLRKLGVGVIGLDYFAPGYHYSNTTRKADLSGESCGGWGKPGYEPEACVPVKDASVDGIIIIHVLEHVLPIAPGLEQLARIAKKGAWMQVEVPCEPKMETHACRKDAASRRLSGTSDVCAQQDHLVAYNCESFKELVEKSGWTCDTSWDALGKPDAWVLNRYGILDYPGKPSFVSEQAKRLLLCSRT